MAKGRAERLLEQPLAVGVKMWVIEPKHLKKVNVDTTLQDKHVRFPTDWRLYNRDRERLARLAKERGISLRQRYARVGPKELHQQSRYAQAKQYKRVKRSIKKLRTYLGRVIRDIERQMGQWDGKLVERCPWPSGSKSSGGKIKTKFTACTHQRWSASANARRTRDTRLE